MSRQLRSAVKCVPNYKLILATDGLIGKTPTSKNIEVISVEQGSFEEVEDALEEIINTNNHLKPAVLMSAGNTNISLSYWGINPGLIRGRSREVRNQMVVRKKLCGFIEGVLTKSIRN